MRRGRGSLHRPFLLGLLVFALAGTGCARFRHRLPSEPPEIEKSTEKAALPEGKEPQSASTNRFKLDPNKALLLQMKALDEQNQDEVECVFRRPNTITGWLDRFHEQLFCRMDNAVRRLDTMWLSDSMAYDYELSTFTLRTLTRVGGRSNDKEYDFKVRFRADVALPGLEKQAHLFLDNAGRSALPGSDLLQQEDETRLGVRTMWKTLMDNQLDLSTGLRFSSSKPIVFADLEWEWKRDLADGQIRLCPSGFWYSGDGFGQMTELTWTRPLGERKIFQTRTAEQSGEDKVGVEFEQSIRFAWLRSGRGRGWLVQASVFPHIEYSEWVWDKGMVQVSWRDALYRKWIYYTITQQVDFPREDDYQARPSLRIGLEMLFGGQIGNLM